MKKIAIVGAGISGLYIANLFKQSSNYEITIYEKNNSINTDEGYGIQLSVNSVKLLNKIGFSKLSNNEKFTPEKINFFSVKYSDKICELDITKFNTYDNKYTTLKRSTLINFLKKDLGDIIKIGFKISNINDQNKKIKIFFENNEAKECDYLIISDGVFSKSKSLISNNKVIPKYNDTLAIRGRLTKSPENVDNKNINLFLGPNFHHVIYPLNSNGDLNFIAIMKYFLSSEERKNHLLFSKDSFINKILENVPKESKNLFNLINEIKIFPVFVSDSFFKIKNNNIHFIGDAFFAFPPSFAQGASQSIESAFELFNNIENKTEKYFFRNRVNKVKMVNNRSKFNQYAFHLSSPFTTFLRDILLKRLVKNKKFLEIYLGKIYKF
tara:strand:+ start:5337 stop:6482 length:1146 start_codon:yes stop_codon:yes gene_type:complete